MLRLRLALVALLLAALAPAGAAATGPTLRVVRTQPLTVRGAHFVPRERVTVTAIGRERSKVLVRTTRSGTFTAIFTSPVFDPCGQLQLRAIGRAGDRGIAVARLPECMSYLP